MSAYEGVCVGGPMDGQRHEGVSAKMVCNTSHPSTLRPHVDHGRIETDNYVFRGIILDHGETVGVWVHESLVTPGDVLRALVEGYRKEVEHGH